MNCTYHPDTKAVDICPVCHQPICENCMVSLSGKGYCRQCLEKKMDDTVPPRPKNRFLAFLCSLVPGCGYFYLGLMKLGLQTMIIFFGAISVGAFLGFGTLVAFVVPILVFYSVFDTQQLITKLHQGQVLTDRELFDWGSFKNKRGFIGAVLILLGSLTLIDNLIPYFEWYFLRSFLPPLLIIGTGIYILYQNFSDRNESMNGKGEISHGNHKDITSDAEQGGPNH